MSMPFKRIKDWSTSITAFRTGDVIPVDGPSGTAKMSKDDLMCEAAGFSHQPKRVARFLSNKFTLEDVSTMTKTHDSEVTIADIYVGKETAGCVVIDFTSSASVNCSVTIQAVNPSSAKLPSPNYQQIIFSESVSGNKQVVVNLAKVISDNFSTFGSASVGYNINITHNGNATFTLNALMVSSNISDYWNNYFLGEPSNTQFWVDKNFASQNVAGYSVTHESSSDVLTISLGKITEGNIVINCNSSVSLRTVVYLRAVNILSGNLPSPSAQKEILKRTFVGDYTLSINLREAFNLNPKLTNDAGTRYEIVVNHEGNGTFILNSLYITDNVVEYWKKGCGYREIPRFVKASSVVNEVGTSVTGAEAFIAGSIYIARFASGYLRINVTCTRKWHITLATINLRTGNQVSRIEFADVDAGTSYYSINLADALTLPNSTYYAFIVHVFVPGAGTAKINSIECSNPTLVGSIAKWCAGTGNTYVVRKDGNGDFTKITDALTAVQTEFYPIVHVREGVYDIIDELGASFFSDLTNEQGMWAAAGLKLIGAPNTKIQCLYDGANPNVPANFSILNHPKVPIGFEIVGIDFVCTGIHYIIHDDSYGVQYEVRDVIVGCNMSLDNSALGYAATQQCIGGGLGTNTLVEIRNCIFESKKSSASTGSRSNNAVTYHNTTKIAGKSRVIIDSCYMKGTAGTFSCQGFGPSTDSSEFICTNCNLPEEPVVVPETSESPNNFTLYAWNNVIRNP